MTGTPLDKDLVLVGGGHSHVHVLKMFGMRPLPGVRLTLVTRTAETPYSGMLPGFIAGCYDHDRIHLDLVRLARFAGARLVLAEACGLDRAARRVLLPGR
ncbi:MAG: pyridine nucleotide-disulfide oxidoreductase, partial [Caenispirillum sp.]|nr:pyridine nucleotide-disulfide oxidoreductase [Caenispirillum sp.]